MIQTTMTKPLQEAPRIMIVDDTPQNLELLESLLQRQGYQVFALPSGEMALQAAACHPPDIMLLDIVMPGMDGYEVCTRLKADPRLKEIPVLFLSGLHDTWDKVRAFQVGGVDYISKPFQIEEVEVRVRSQLELRRQQNALRAAHERLREMERLRDNLVHLLVHDLRSPLGAIRMTVEMMSAFVPTEDPELPQMVAIACRSLDQLSEMVTQLLDISRFEAGQMPVKRTPGDAAELVRLVQASLVALAEGRRLVLTVPETLPAVFDADLIRRVLVNLLANAVKFTLRDGEVKIQVSREAGQIRVAVTDDGPGIPAELHDKIFEKFGQVENQHAQRGTGLGLTFCKLAVEAHGGQIGVISQAGQGSTFWFTFPVDVLRQA